MKLKYRRFAVLSCVSNRRQRVAEVQHIVITGASSGIGKALAESYAASGAHLTLTGRNSGRLEAVAAACRNKGATVDARVIDVRDKDAMAAFLNEIDHSRPIDLLIANAGVSRGTSGEIDYAARDAAILDINVHGVLNTVVPVVTKMRARRSGQIALMSSLAGFRGMPSDPAYFASKAWVRSYGEGISGRCHEDGVSVSVICPGFVASLITASNKFPMPMFMEADKAAKIIRRGLAKKKHRIAFPWPMYFMVWLMNTIPVWISELIVRRLPEKE